MPKGIETGLAGKVVIVTGAAAGIGRATAMRFAGEGAVVAGWDVDSGKGAGLAKELEQAGGKGLFQQVDVTSKADVRSAVVDLVQAHGQIDVLINNAGIVRDSQLVKWKNGELLSEMSEENFDAVIAVNLKGVFNCTQAVAPHMIERRSGVVLTASSVVGLYGNFGQTNYSATKGAVITMSRTWAREFGRYGIRVNVVAPGFVATEILQSMPQKVIDNMVARTPMGRMGTPEDLANAYLWLASDAASFVHGAVISVDGGIVLGT